MSRQTLMPRRILLSLFALLLAACGSDKKADAGPKGQQASPPSGQRAEAVIAGGCFWCAEADFDKLDGVLETISGYTGGTLDNPAYEDVVTETTGHYEALRIVYDPEKLDYPTLLRYFWRHVDPTDAGGQFCDRGPSYRAAIFTADPAQKAVAEAQKKALDAAGTLPGPVATEILPLGKFWPAEDYHQDYHTKNPLRYGLYRNGCGRDRRVENVWRNTPDSAFVLKAETAASRQITTESPRDFASTLSSVRKAVAENGFTLLAEVDHAAGAKKVGLTLAPSTLLIFGNPAGGTPLMLADPEIGIDLPLRMLVYQDDDGKTHIVRQNLTNILLEAGARDRYAGFVLRQEAGIVEAIEQKLAAIAAAGAGNTGGTPPARARR